MIIRSAYKYQLKVTDRQADQLSRSVGCCRLVWNKTLAMQKARLEIGERILTYEQTSANLPTWKQELPFLKEAPSQPLQQALMNLARAFKDYFAKEKGFPNFKRKFEHDSCRFPQGTKVDGSKIYLPTIGWVRFRRSREILGKVKNVTISKKIDKWYVSIQTERELADPIHPSQSAVGIDLGIARFATMSDGTVIESINSFRKLERKLAFQQRKLSQKAKGSNNWKKQKRKIQRLHHKIACVRGDFLHKSTTDLAKNHGVIVLEDLKVANMSKSAKGSLEKPGTNVAAKTGLNKSITDQGWYEFKRQLSYKQDWLGGKVILVNPTNTSCRCSRCQHIATENRPSQAHFECQNCDYTDNADLNAAKNILAAGQAVSACRDTGQEAA